MGTVLLYVMATIIGLKKDIAHKKDVITKKKPQRVDEAMVGLSKAYPKQHMFKTTP